MSLLGRLLGRGGSNDVPQEPVLVNAYATMLNVPDPDFAQEIHDRRDLSDPELAEHLNGFTGYVMSRGDGQMTASRYHLWRHIQRVQNHLSFSLAPDQFGILDEWARAANAILFLPDGSVRAPDMAVLIDQAGESDPSAVIPYPADAQARREVNLQRLAGFRPQPPTSMPPALGEGELVARHPVAVLHRALALACVALRAENLAQGEPDIRPFLTENNPQGMISLTPKERAYVHDDAPDTHTTVQMSWRYEALNVLLWALGDPAGDLSQSDAPADAALLWRAARTLAEQSPAYPQLRPAADILDALDRTWREHWIVRQASQQGEDVTGLHPDVVMERHVALNWLTGFHNEPGTEWDDIDTPS